MTGLFFAQEFFLALLKDIPRGKWFADRKYILERSLIFQLYSKDAKHLSTCTRKLCRRN